MQDSNPLFADVMVKQVTNKPFPVVDLITKKGIEKRTFFMLLAIQSAFNCMTTKILTYEITTESNMTYTFFDYITYQHFSSKTHRPYQKFQLVNLSVKT